MFKRQFALLPMICCFYSHAAASLHRMRIADADADADADAISDAVFGKPPADLVNLNMLNNEYSC